MNKHHGDLDAPLLQLSPSDLSDLETDLKHVLILGIVGSGKTSGTMKHSVVAALLRASLGGICVAEPESAEPIEGH